MLIRDYRPEDEAAWLACWGQFAVTSHAWGNPPYAAKPKYGSASVELLAVDESGWGPAWAGTPGLRPGLVVGLIDVEIENEPGELGLLTDSRCGFVWEFGLLPAYRRRGLGRGLVVAAAERLEQAGVRRMEFWSMDENAQAVYERLGMKEINRHWRFWLKMASRSQSVLGGQGEAPQSLRFVQAHATASVEDWPKVVATGQVIETPPLEPHLCRGFDYRF